MRLFRVKNSKFRNKKGSDVASRSTKRVILLNNQYKHGFKVDHDYYSVLKKCKEDLEILKEQVVDYTKELEVV